MIKTRGLTHISLKVADPEASLKFYEAAFGVRVYVREENEIQVLGPGEHDVLVFVKSDKAGAKGGIDHFGFRLDRAEDMGEAIETLKAVGAKILRTGEHSPGYPYLYFEDPDGYEVEIWYE